RNEQKQNGGQLSNGACQLAHQRFSSRSAVGSPPCWRTRTRRLKRSLFSCGSKLTPDARPASANRGECSNSGSKAAPDLARPVMSRKPFSSRKSVSQTLLGNNFVT